MDIVLHYVGSKVIEDGGFQILRQEGSPRYIFFHFISSVEEVLSSEGVVHANPGGCILYTPNTPQRLTTGSVRLSHDYLDFTVNDNGFLDSIKFPLNVVFYPNMSRRISEDIAKIEELQDSDLAGANYEISLLIEALFIDIARKSHHHSVGPKKEYVEKLRSAFEDLRLEVYEQPEDKTVASLAKKMDFSKAYFSTMYSSFFNISPVEDIKKAKMQKVSELVYSGEKSTVIAENLGFKSTEYFYRWFKGCFGCTTKQYLLQKGKNSK
jgi:AraC-like DNA-binding protein